MPVYETIVDAMSVPTFVKLSTNLYGASFECMKALPADFIVGRALERGDVSPSGTVIDTSSGTFARGLAWAARKHGVQCTVVTSSLMDEWLQSSLRAFGATVEVVEDPGTGLLANQVARMDRLKQILGDDPKVYWTCQYQNPDNSAAYEALANQIRDNIGKIDFLVGAVGTGGSTGGTATGLRKQENDVKLVGVDLTGSVLFGQEAQREPRRIGGMSSAQMPPCIQHELYDLVSWVPEEVATHYLWDLYEKQLLYHGASSGSVFAVAAWLNRRHPDRKIVAIFPDSGFRYHRTFYDRSWVQAQNLYSRDVPKQPIQVEHPRDSPKQWTWIDWARRSYRSVVGADPNPEVFR